MKSILKMILFLLACGGACASYAGTDRLPLPSAGVLSTNWLAEVKKAVPSADLPRESSFEAITTLLRAESQGGNTAAQGFWGFFLLVQRQSPEDAATGLQLLRNSATNGFVPAMVNLGLLFESGEYVPRDYNEAFYWFTQAAEKNNPDGLLELGGCHHYGLGTTRDLTKAAECYQRAAELTNYVAMKSLGCLLMEDRPGVQKDTEAAKAWLLRAAKEGGNRRAMFNLGVLCGTNVSDTTAMAEAFQWFKQSAELGDGLACHQLANFYYRGWGGVQTNAEAYRSWRLKAAISGATAAQYDMGAAYRTGEGVAKDIEAALVWYQKAAAKNHPPALYALALLFLGDKATPSSRSQAENYMLRAAQAGHREAQFQCAMSSFRGDVGAPDCEAGKRWLAKAAESGWPRAEFCLYRLIYNGSQPSEACPNYPKDVPLAVQWLRRAAQHEDLHAQAVLAVLLTKGKDVEQNKAEAEGLMRNAAEHGYAPAQNDLGFAILNGDTAKMDLVEAAMWCRLAQSQVTDSNVLRRVEVNLANISSKLDANQRLEADGRMKNFRALPIADPDPMIKDWEENPAYQQEDGRYGH
jgi:TPR repeat protein